MTEGIVFPEPPPEDLPEAEAPEPLPWTRCPFCGSPDTGVSRSGADLFHRMLWLGGGAVHVCDRCRRRFVVCAAALRHPRRLFRVPGVCLVLALRGRRPPAPRPDDPEDPTPPDPEPAPASPDAAEPPPLPARPLPPGLAELDWLWLTGSTGLRLTGLGLALASLVAGLDSAALRDHALVAAGVFLVLTLLGALLGHLGHVDPDRDYRARPFTASESRLFGVAGFLAQALGMGVLAGLVLALGYVVLHFAQPSGAAVPPQASPPLR